MSLDKISSLTLSDIVKKKKKTKFIYCILQILKLFTKAIMYEIILLYHNI